MECLGLHNKPTAEVLPGHMLTGPKEEEETEAEAKDQRTEGRKMSQWKKNPW
jgi:hypothetical protein